MSYTHTPVLLQEVLYYLEPKPNMNYIDGTLGGGGYSLAILEKLAPRGKVLSIDLDTHALENYKLNTANLKLKNNAVFVHGNFADIDKIVEKHNFFKINGIVLDLGLSSYELDSSGRGISFQKKEPLDMRFDLKSQGVDAKFIVNRYTQKQLEEIFRKYGEEKNTGKIVREILRAREKQPIHYSTELFEIIRSALPKPVRHKAADSARRIFQALRMAVNHELENLQTFLPKASAVLNPGGRLAVVSFHSLEDRAVKQFFKAISRGCVCPPDFPLCVCGKSPQAKTLTPKPITPSEAELLKNPRSKSAKLRVIQKL